MESIKLSDNRIANKDDVERIVLQCYSSSPHYIYSVKNLKIGGVRGVAYFALDGVESVILEV